MARRTIVLSILVLTALVPPAARAIAGGGSDFNGDGFDDLAIGVPGEDGGAGIVLVLFGSTAGLSGTGSLTLSQGSDIVPDEGEPADAFGSSITTGDFDGDGFDDLAIGAPGEDERAGAVVVLPGSETGLGSGRLWMQGLGLRGSAEPGDGFGATLAAGDFNGDGFDELAIGAPGETIESGVSPDPGMIVGAPGAGSIGVIFGSAAGLTDIDDQRWHQETAGIQGHAEACKLSDGTIVGDRFGSALAAGDFDGDGFEDVAIGVPGEVPDTCTRGDVAEDQGAVNMIFGGALGLQTDGDLFFDQSDFGDGGASEIGDRYGATLAAGDLDADGFDDLAVGIPGERTQRDGSEAVGGIDLLTGRPDRILVGGARVLASPGADLLGAALELADLNVDGKPDIVAGVPGTNGGTIIGAVVPVDGTPASDSGSVWVKFGAESFLAGDEALLMQGPQFGIEGIAEGGDLFGASLATGDFNGDGVADLAVGTPHDGGFPKAATGEGGGVNVFYGGADGVGTDDDVAFSQASDGVAGDPEPGDRFGTL